MNMNRQAGEIFGADLACRDVRDEGYFLNENGPPIISSFPLLTFEVMVDHPDRLYIPLKRGGPSRLQVSYASIT